MDSENRKLTQRLHENLEEMRAVTQERDDLRSVEETLKADRERLRESLEDAVARVSCHLTLCSDRSLLCCAVLVGCWERTRALKSG